MKTTNWNGQSIREALDSERENLAMLRAEMAREPHVNARTWAIQANIDETKTRIHRMELRETEGGR